MTDLLSRLDELLGPMFSRSKRDEIVKLFEGSSRDHEPSPSVALDVAMMAAAQRAASESDDFLGELLRAVAFTSEGYGCYENFDLIAGFKPVIPSPALISHLTGETDESINAFYSEALDLFVAWYWDGDGTLYFDSGIFGRAVWNTDCKKPWDWEETERFAGVSSAKPAERESSRDAIPLSHPIPEADYKAAQEEIERRALDE